MDSHENTKQKVKPGRVDGKNCEYRSGKGFVPKKIKHQIEVVLQQHRDKAAHKDKKVGSSTQDKRETEIKNFFKELFKLGYKIEDIHNLKEKHLKAVFGHLEDMKQAPSTIQNKISIMRTFCGWIGKAGMVRDSAHYVKDKVSVRRSGVAQEDKSWDGKGVDVLTKVAEVQAKDMNVAAWLELCLGFGLRVREAIMSRPCMADEGAYLLVQEGTKGGRPRIVPVENEVQRDILIRAKALADGKTGFLGVRGKTYQQKRRRFYTVMECLGITFRDGGVTAHGLRHQYMHESFKRLLGIDPPIKGGDLSEVDKQELHVASQKLMERAGHTRVTIGSAYYGSRRIPVKKLEAEDTAVKSDTDDIPENKDEVT